MKFYIYQIWFPTSNKRYIGQTRQIKNRMNQHLNSGSLVCRALYKYDNWQVSILHTCKTRDEANRVEIEEIRNFNSVKPNGYNISRGGEGGEGGDTFTNNPNKEKIRVKHKNAAMGNKYAQGHNHTEEWKSNKSNEMRERIISGETKVKLSEALQGNQNSKDKNLGNKYAQGKRSEEFKQKHSGEKNVSHRVDVKISRLRTRIANLQKELESD